MNQLLYSRNGHDTVKTLKSLKASLPLRFKCGFEGSPSPQDEKRRENHTPKTSKIKTTRRHKPSFRPGLRYIFASRLFGFRHAGHALLAKTDQWNGCNLCNGSKVINQSEMAFRELRANWPLIWKPKVVYQELVHF